MKTSTELKALIRNLYREIGVMEIETYLDEENHNNKMIRVWSGSLVAVLLDMRFKCAFPTIFIGNMIVGIIRMMLSHGVVSVIGG